MNDNQSSREKLEALRREIKAQGLDGFLVSTADEYLGEYVPASAKRLAWATGFTGSNGTAVILQDKAALFTDGRYTNQAKQELDASLYEVRNFIDMRMSAWLAQEAAKGAKIGYDPRLHGEEEAAGLKAKLEAQGMQLVPVAANPVDVVWQNRPAPPAEPVIIFPEAVAGRSTQQKREDIVSKIREANGQALIIEPESIAWLLNIRGNDVPHTPLALSHAILHESGEADWFIDAKKVTPDVRQHIGNQVHIREPEELAEALKELAQAAKAAGKPVLTDGDYTPAWFRQQLEAAGASVKNIQDPCILPRARKTPEEQQAIIEAHVRDGVAVVRFLKWAEENLPQGGYTELDVAEELENFRRMDPSYRDNSFDTIAGWAGNGAIIHYRATPEKHKEITPPGILLVDSGAQYMGDVTGTTDITRTVAVGEPTDEMRENFTRVLQGHIGLATLRFPEGLNGSHVDVLARKALWDAGLDYDHGTGHGVGCYLSVHEEAASIATYGKIDFSPGMLISNEPGFYKEGAYGIRLENLVLVREEGKREHTDRDVKFMGFETVTLAPFDKRLIRPEMMGEREMQWLDDYHERVYRTLSPLLKPDEAQWLRAATAPLKKNLEATPDIKSVRTPGPGPAPG